MDEQRRAEVLWAYSITHERILERLVKKERISQERADAILDMLIDTMNEKEIEKHCRSKVCKKEIESFLHLVIDSEDFVSLTALARTENNENPSYVIQSWLRSRNTIEFLRLWEKENNPDFNEDGYNHLVRQINLPSFTLTAKKWITQTNAIGLISKQGNNGGTLAHPDIAFDFQVWMSPEKRYEVVNKVLREIRLDKNRELMEKSN